MEPLIIRPNRRVFVIRPVMWTAILVGLVAVVSRLVLTLFQISSFSAWIWVMGYVVIIAAVALTREVRYGKTSYALLADRVVHKTGGLFSEATTELQYRQITQVRLRLPYIVHRLFGTGRLTIHAAGSTLSSVVFEAIDEPRRIYDEVGARMKGRGFALSRGRMLQDERPSPIASLFDMGSHMVTMVVAIVSVLLWGAGLIIDLLALDGYGGLFGLLTGAIDDYGNEFDVALMRQAVWGLGLVGLGVVFWTVVATVLHYVDLIRRRYTLYDDVIDYEDGFLTQTFEFIPIENLSDVEINEPLLKRVLGVADVMLSCQGAGTHIQFTSMPNALRFKGRLQEVLEKKNEEEKSRDKAETASVTDGPVDGPAKGLTPLQERTGAGPSGRGGARAPRVIGTTGPRREFSMSMGRALALQLTGLLVGVAVMVLIFFVLFTYLPEVLGDETDSIALYMVLFGGVLFIQSVAAMVKTAIEVHATRYVLGQQKIESRYEFVAKRQVEFAMERVTGLVVRRSPLDRLLGTLTLEFRSIGSSVPLVFKHVADDGDLVTEVLTRLGLMSEKTPRQVAARFNLGNWVRAHLPQLLFGGVFALGSVVLMVVVHEGFVFGALMALVVAVAAFAYEEVFYRRQKVEVFDGHMRLVQGVFIREDRYFAFEHIKTVSSTRYIGISTGSLAIQAANHGGMAGFLPAVGRVHDWMDEILFGHGRDPDDDVSKLATGLVVEKKPLGRNTLLRYGLICLVLPPFLFVLLWRYLAVKRTAFGVEEDRLVVSMGIFYRRQITILFDRVDHIRRTRGAIDKLFGTGAIEVYTVGSPTADATLFDVAGEGMLFEAIDVRIGDGEGLVQG